MRTRQSSLLDLLGADNAQFVIPVYQRLYAWTEKQCQVLWADIIRAGHMQRRHFLSTLLYIPQTDDEHDYKVNSIIDGQQRCATVTLVLVALSRYLHVNNQVLDDGNIDADAISRMFLHCDGSSDGDLRLVLSRGDYATLESVVNGGILPETPSENVVSNLRFFSMKMGEEGFDPNILWRGLKSLTVIYAELTDSDDPQLVFESLNSKGMPLTTADLIRNFLLIAMTHAEQARLYDEYWVPIENMFQPDPGSLKLNNAVHGWLQVRYTKVRALKANEVYAVFKSYIEDEYDGTTEELLDELRSFCLVWAENYKYHAVKAYRSKFDWAKNGRPKTLVSHYEVKGGGSANLPDHRDIDIYL